MNNIDKLYKTIIEIYNSNNSLETKKNNFNILLNEVKTSIYDEKNKLIDKFNNDIIELNNSLKIKTNNIENYKNLILKKRIENMTEYNRIKFPDGLIELNINLKNLENQKDKYFDDLDNIKENLNSNKDLIFKKKNEIDFFINIINQKDKEEVNYIKLCSTVKEKEKKKYIDDVNKIKKYILQQDKIFKSDNNKIVKEIDKLGKKYNKNKKIIDKKIEEKKNEIFKINNKILLLEKKNDIDEIDEKNLSIMKLEIKDCNLEVNSNLEESIFIDQNYVLDNNALEKKIIENKKNFKLIKNKKEYELEYRMINYDLRIFKYNIKNVNIEIIKRYSRNQIAELRNIIKEKDILCDELKKANLIIQSNIMEINNEIYNLTDKKNKEEKITLKNYKFFSNHSEIDIQNLNFMKSKLQISINQIKKELILYHDLINILNDFNDSNYFNEIMIEIDTFIKKGFGSDEFNILILLINYHKMILEYIDQLSL